MATGLRAVFQSADVSVSGGRLNKKERKEMLKNLKSCWDAPPICTSVAISFWQRYLVKLAALGVDSAPPGQGTPFMEGERVVLWSEAHQAWSDAVVVGRNTDGCGNLLSYDLDLQSGVDMCRVQRPLLARPAEKRAIELILRYIPLKADRALPGDLLRVLADHGWVPVIQVPNVLRSILVQPPPIIVAPALAPSPSQASLSEGPSTREPTEELSSELPTSIPPPAVPSFASRRATLTKDTVEIQYSNIWVDGVLGEAL